MNSDLIWEDFSNKVGEIDNEIDEERVQNAN